MFRFAALKHPDDAALISQVIAVPTKRFDRAIVTYLTPEEVEVLLAAPDRSRWIGRRDYVLLTVAIQTGVRVSELNALRRQDVHLGTGAHVQISGKGRKQRATPLTKQTVAGHESVEATQIYQPRQSARPRRDRAPAHQTHQGASQSAITVLSTPAQAELPVLGHQEQCAAGSGVAIYVHIAAWSLVLT
jgi:integrase